MAAVTPSELRALAGRSKLAAIGMVRHEGFGYLGQAFSSAEVFAVLFGGGFIRVGVDRFVLSPGHYAIGLYAVTTELGLLPKEELTEYGKDGALFEAISSERTPLVDLTCGSMGQGISGAIGFALADRMAGRDARTYVFVSDGELEEGQTWEAAMFAAHERLDALTVVVDANGSQCDGPIEAVTTIEPIAGKWEAFGWTALEVDGHDVEALRDALERARETAGPVVVVARTDIFGRLDALKGLTDGHFIKLDPALDAALVAELEEAIAHA